MLTTFVRKPEAPKTKPKMEGLGFRVYRTRGPKLRTSHLFAASSHAQVLMTAAPDPSCPFDGSKRSKPGRCAELSWAEKLVSYICILLNMNCRGLHKDTHTHTPQRQHVPGYRDGAGGLCSWSLKSLRLKPPTAQAIEERTSSTA